MCDKTTCVNKIKLYSNLDLQVVLYIQKVLNYKVFVSSSTSDQVSFPPPALLQVSMILGMS